jgi:WD40 repeat protein
VLRFVDVNSGDIVYQVGLLKAIYCIKIVHDRLLITAGQGNKISLWDTEKLRKSREKKIDDISLEAESFPVMQLDLLREMHGPIGYSTYALEVISIVVNWKEISKSSGSDRIGQPAGSSINLLVTGGRAKTLDLWDLETGENVLSIPTPRNAVVHSLAYHLLKQTFQFYSDCENPSHLTGQKLQMGSKQSTDRESTKYLIRVFAGADNGLIYCWDFTCSASRAVADHPNVSPTHPQLMVTTIDCKINCGSDRGHLNNDGNTNTKLDGYQGVYHGHQNIVNTLQLLTPPEANNYAEERRQAPLRMRSLQRPILVSASKDNSDVRLWQADYPFTSKISSSETRNKKSSSICQLKNGHSRAIRTLATAPHTQQQSQFFRRMNVFVENSTNDIDVIRKRGEIIYDLLTCGADNKVCVWDVCQILKDLKWQKIRWFVLLTKQISNIVTRGFDDINDALSNSAGIFEGSLSIFQKTSMVADSISTNVDMCEGMFAGHQDDLTKLRFILIKISHHVDVLSAVGSYLV